jgi:hypothetical protein
MKRVPTPADLTGLRQDLELAHRQAVSAATAGLSDAALGRLRLSGTGVPALAEAAVSSATPFLRAPLLARLSQVRLLHPVQADDAGCPTCGVPAPCPTALEVSP